MSRDRYPRLGTSRKQQRRARREISCYRCGVGIGSGKPYFLQDVQVNQFRGDDDVVKLCPACHAWCWQHNAIPKPLPLPQRA